MGKNKWLLQLSDVCLFVPPSCEGFRWGGIFPARVLLLVQNITELQGHNSCCCYVCVTLGEQLFYWNNARFTHHANARSVSMMSSHSSKRNGPRKGRVHANAGGFNKSKQSVMYKAHTHTRTCTQAL